MTVQIEQESNTHLEEELNPPNRRQALVDFMIVGAQKCGTTTLAAQLAAHPDVCFCKEKEPGFFNSHVDWEDKLDEYHSLYTPANGQICGEASTMYTFFPEVVDVHERLYRYNPALKLIYIMRNPVERAVSLYAHNVVRNIEKSAPEQAIFKDPTYLNRSRYGMQIQPFIELFGRENVLLLVFEEYIADQNSALAQVADFLNISVNGFNNQDDSHNHKSVGVPYLKYEFVRQITSTDLFQSLRTYVPQNIRYSLRSYVSNTLEEKPEFSPPLRQAMRRFVDDDINAIERLLERKIPAWQR
ncbi:MAG: sulfotransferase domain-containing protein [Chloroflexota bacterium]